MMNKEETLLAIRVSDAIQNLDHLIIAMTGGEGLTGSSFDDMFRVMDLLYRNCSFYEPMDDKCFARFMDIICAEDLTAEEKYERMKGGAE